MRDVDFWSKVNLAYDIARALYYYFLYFLNLKIEFIKTKDIECYVEALGYAEILCDFLSSFNLPDDVEAELEECYKIIKIAYKRPKVLYLRKITRILTKVLRETKLAKAFVYDLPIEEKLKSAFE